MSEHPVVTRSEWLEARRALLAKEKEFSRLRDELSRQQRELPWARVEKDYIFEGPDGEVSLSDLFQGRSQLIVYHFMFDPDWDEGCKSCSYLADHFDPAIIHMNQRDISMAVVSRGPLEKLLAFKERMGWKFRWVSSLNNDFNRDFKVSFTSEDEKRGEVEYNFSTVPFFSTEGPGLSVFKKGDDGAVYHTYSTYSRGLDAFIGAYRFIDVTPKGRDEDGLEWPMAWVRFHDSYGD